MALKSFTQIKLQDCSLGIQHSVPIGQAMSGHVPAVPALPAPPYQYDDVRHVVIFAQPLDDQMGLFDPGPHVNSKVHAFCVGVQIIQGGGIAYNVYLTSGDTTLGTPTVETIHDPAYDMLLATGTGTAYVNINRELMPGQRIRVVLGVAAGIPSRVIAMFANTIGPGGRLLGD